MLATLALLLVAGCSDRIATAAPINGGATSSPAAAFVAFPARTADYHAPEMRVASHRGNQAAQSPPGGAQRRRQQDARRRTVRVSPRGRLYASNVVEGLEKGGAAVAAAAADAAAAAVPPEVALSEQEKKRKATKAALLGVFGEAADDAGPAAEDPILACPATLGDLSQGARSYGGSLLVEYLSSEKMPGTKYQRGPVFVDFADPPKAAWRLSRGESVKESTFQTPLVSWLYERGWRQGFNANGFPGIDEEFRQVTQYFSSLGADGQAVIDLSCGSGLMMRRLVASGRYSRVIGGDLSPTMLAETARRFKEEGLGDPELIRCDVSRLPLKTESLDGVHAGAALHCWSKLEDSLAEVHRVLKPGRGFFATTFLTSASLSRAQEGDGFKFFEVDELDRLMRDAGFEDVKVVKEGRGCAIVRATKGKQ
ncbi:unnamed protein product [Scytosiphon promiscuus]